MTCPSGSSGTSWSRSAPPSPSSSPPCGSPRAQPSQRTRSTCACRRSGFACPCRTTSSWTVPSLEPSPSRTRAWRTCCAFPCSRESFAGSSGAPSRTARPRVRRATPATGRRARARAPRRRTRRTRCSRSRVAGAAGPWPALGLPRASAPSRPCSSTSSSSAIGAVSTPMRGCACLWAPIGWCFPWPTTRLAGHSATSGRASPPLPLQACSRAWRCS
mmetsp:Transcript_42967/g.132968  ORF Transcript_42967/g.132968 Transcript_42967/m.132968 type:complete len:217 (+) Transcript_42967:137-787(+)